MKKLTSVLALTTVLFTFMSCEKKGQNNTKQIAVYVPGIMADSPIYANLAKGVQNGAGENAQVTILEAGTNQAEWSTKLTALTATGKYDVIISSNPSLPEIAEPLTKQFPNQKYIFLDADMSGNPNMATISYNQKEQSFLSGYIAGLYSKTHKVALVAAQEYPVMNNILYPYYKKGAQAAYPDTECQFRVVGNWYDASKGAEITDALYSNGTDVILPICGGASQGVIATASAKGIKINWFDENGFAKAPGVIISSCMTMQQKAAEEITKMYLEGNINWGTSKTVGFSEGYIEFVQDDPLYIQHVPQDIRDKMSALIQNLKNGTYKIEE